MRSHVQDFPLTVDALFRRGEEHFSHKLITSFDARGQAQITYAEWSSTVRALAGALDAIGVSAGATVGSFAWNSARHLSLHFAVPSSGRVLHCVNIRLFPEQIVFIINHAADEALVVDRSLLPVLAPLLPQCRSLRHLIVMDDGSEAHVDLQLVNVAVHDFDELVADAAPVEFAVQDERTPAAMCYTSGTTGDPKGVVYSHRSIFLHSMAASAVGTLGINEADRILTLVPMFHANAWGIPHAAIAQGAELVLPGSDLSGARVADLLEGHQITMTAGVPTLWMAALPHLRGRDLSHLRLIACGGAAVPMSLSESYRTAIGQPIQQAWGMTETSPLAAVGRLDGDHLRASEAEQARLRTGVGRPVLGVEARLVEPDTLRPIAKDGRSSGELQVRGPWIASGYFDTPLHPSSFTVDGWLRTGDVATMDARGWIRLVDRTKDLIKSGGGGSPADLESHLMNHHGVAEAAVVGVPHPRWSERPLACVVRAPGSEVTEEDLREHLAAAFAKWQLPDRILFVQSIPKTGVGKFSKLEMRKEHQDVYGGA